MNKVFNFLVAASFSRILFFGALLGGLYYYALYDDGSTLKSQIANIDTQVQAETVKKKDTEKNLNEEKRIKENVGLLSQQYLVISKKLPTSLTKNEVVKFIDSFSKQSNLKSKSIKPEEVISQEVVDELPISVTFVGKYSEIAKFIYKLSRSDKILRFRKMTIGKSTDQTGTLELMGTISGYKLATEKETNTTSGQSNVK